MALASMCWTLARAILDISIVTAIIILFPGLPPYVKFESYSLTPVMKLEGPLERNSIMDTAKVYPIKEGFMGPESIAIRGDELYTGTIGGWVQRIKGDNISTVVKFGRFCDAKWKEAVCGRPLGMRFNAAGKLIVVDAYYGLFSVDVDTGKYETLVSSSEAIDGKHPMNPNDLDIAKDGTIYWSDSSTNYYLNDAIFEFLGEPSGRLLKYDPKTKKTTVLMTGLHFANGVQLSSNEEFVLVAESCRSRIMRYYLKGSKMGQSDIFIDGLPGSPDNIRPDGKGGIFASLIVPRYPWPPSPGDALGPLPWARKFLLRLLSIMKSGVGIFHAIVPDGSVLQEYTGKAQYWLGHLEPVAVVIPRHAIVVRMDQSGKILGSLHATQGKVAHISEISVDNKGEFAYLGSPYNTEIWKLSLSKPKPGIPEMKLG